MKIYFSGISGVAIGPLAMLADDAGYEVCGSDLVHSAYFDALNERGITTYEGQDGSQIKTEHEKSPIDWFVMTAALPEDHPELAYAKKQGIPISKRDKLINQIIRDKDLKLIAVSGTHGKTTTTAMLIWLFKKLNMRLSYSVGSSISFGPSAQHQEGSEYFIYEADEFDRNFLKFAPHSSLVTTLDFDHPDTYVDQQDYNQAFADFLEATHTHKVIWDTDSETLPDYIVDDCVIISETDPMINTINIPGLHNRQNAFMAIRLLSELLPAIDTKQAYDHIASFPGSARRFEKLTDNLYTDYAHHPTEITATIEMARELSDNVVIIYQPHQNKRQQEIMDNGGYKHSFDKASKVYWTPTYLSREPNENIISSETLIATTSKPGDINTTSIDETLYHAIQTELQDGALVLIMTAGDLDSWARDQFVSS